MVTLADFSDTASLAVCKSCGQFLQEGDRFCRFCGQEQDLDTEFITLTDASTGSGVPLVAPAASAPAAAKKLRGRPPPTGVGEGEPLERGPGGGVFPGRWAMGIAALVLVVLAAALLHDLYLSRQEESAHRAELGAALAQVEGALARGDLNEVQLKLAILDALNPNDADVKAKREAFDRRVQDMTAERDRLREAVAKGQSTAAPEPVPAPAEPTTTAAAPAASVPAAPLPQAAPTPTPPAPAAQPPAPPPMAAASPAAPPSPPPSPAAVPASEPPSAPAASAAPATSPTQSSGACPDALAAMALCPSR